MDPNRPLMNNIQPVRLAGSFRCWFVKKYCWLICVREKYCSSWKFTIVYDEPQPNEQADRFYLEFRLFTPVQDKEKKQIKDMVFYSILSQHQGQ